MWSALFSFFLNLFNVLDVGLRSLFRAMLHHLYLLFLPLIALLKLVFDFIRAVIDSVISSMNSISAGGGFSQTEFPLPDYISFVNYFFPIDEILISLSALFTFWVACHIIATIRGIKQTILF